MKLTYILILFCINFYSTTINAQFVPDTRTLTINGTTYDLSANRTWSVGNLVSTGSYFEPVWLTGIDWSIISDVPEANISTSGVVNTTIQTFSGAKEFSTSLSISGTSGNTFTLGPSGFVYDASNNRIGLNNASPSYLFDLVAPSTTGQYYVHRRLVVEGPDPIALLIDFQDSHINWGLINGEDETTIKLRSNEVSFIKNHFIVGDNANDSDNPQFKVVGAQDYSDGNTSWINYQSTVQNHSDINGESASIGFGVDNTKSTIGGYISFVRTANPSKGGLHFGVYNSAGTSIDDVLTLDAGQVTFNKQTASRIAVFNSGKNLISGTLGSGLSLSSDVLSMDINGLAEETSVDRNSDYVAIYDATAGTIDKTKTSNLSLGITLQGVSNDIDPADNENYYVGAIPQISGTTPDLNKVYIPKSGIVRVAYVYFNTGNPSTETDVSTIYLKINSSIFVNLGTITNTSSTSLISATGLSQPVSQGDYLEIKWDCPTWPSDNPEDVRITFVVYIE